VRLLVTSLHLVRQWCCSLPLISSPTANAFIHRRYLVWCSLRRFTDSPFQACARDDQITRRLPHGYSVAERGLASTPQIYVFTDRHHASIEKAAAVVGIGRANVISLPPQRFVEELKENLTRCEEKGEGVVVALSFGEVNTVRDLIHVQSWILRCQEHYDRGFKRENLPQMSNTFDNFATNLERGCISMQVRAVL